MAYVACDTPGGPMVFALDAAAEAVPGWPVRLPALEIASVYDNEFTIGCGDERSSLRISPAGTVLVAAVDATAAHVHALSRDGRATNGSPRLFPGDPPGEDGVGGNGCRGFSLGPDGEILAWGYEGVEPSIELSAARTAFVVYEQDGTIRDGWPRGSTGASSRPVIGSDGRVTYVTAAGRVWQHLPTGEIAAGWPYQLPAREVPYVTSGERVVVLVAPFEGDHGVIALDSEGSMVDGWPVWFDTRIETRCLFGDTPCAGHIGPAIGPSGIVYVSLANGTIVALDRAGVSVPGWPVHLGTNSHATDLTIDQAGLIVARGVVCTVNGCMSDPNVPTTWTLDAEGRITSAEAPK